MRYKKTTVRLWLPMLILSAAASPCLAGTRSATFSASNRANTSFPNSAPYNTWHGANGKFTVVFRVHNASYSGDLYLATLSGENEVPIYLRIVGGNFAVTDYWNKVYDNGAAVAHENMPDWYGCVAYDQAAAQVSSSIWSVTGNYQASATSRITARSSSRMAALQIGGQGAGSARLAFFRVLSGVSDCSTKPKEAVGDGIHQWEFENSGGDTGTGSRKNLSYSGGNPAYTDTPAYSPLCDAGKPVTARAGSQHQLDGSQSTPLNGLGTLTYSWSQTAGPSGVIWSSKTAASPEVSGLVATNDFASDSYVFELTVADSSNATSKCTVKIGAVNSDNQNRVIAAANAPAGMDRLLGPVLRHGTNPWTWVEDRHVEFSRLMTNSLDALFPQPWNTPAAGTVSATNGSATITGTGTSFLSLCSGVAAGQKAIVLWYPSAEYPGTFGRALYYIDSCPDNTHLTLAWRTYGMTAGTTAGMQYSIVDFTSDLVQWRGIGGNPGAISWNYYDNALGFYRLYYSTGIDSYLTTARKISGMHWRNPFVDRGAGFAAKYDPISAQTFGGGRTVAATGLVARMLDEDPAMSNGLAYLWARLGAQTILGGTNLDHRDMGYNIDALGMCGRFDATNKAACLASLRTIATNVLGPKMEPGAPYRVLQSLYTGFPHGYGSGCCASTIRVIDGSTEVVAVAGNPEWTRFQDAATRATVPFILFSDGTGVPTAADLDSRAYAYNSPVSNTSLTLTEPYNSGECPAPAGCVKSWQIYDHVGMGQLVYMVGILTRGLQRAADALEDAGDTIYSAKYLGWAQDSAAWLATVGYNPAAKATYTSRNFVGCEPPGSDNPPGMALVCTGDQEGARQTGMELMSGMVAAYEASPNAAIKSVVDELYTAAFAKPGWGSPLPGDGMYLSILNDGSYGLQATNGVLNSFQQNKWYGFFFGYGNVEGWPAARLAGLSPVKGGPKKRIDTSGGLTVSGSVQ